MTKGMGQRMRMGAVVLLAAGLVGACGTSTGDRALSGGAIGAAAGLAFGADPLVAAVVGGGAAVLADPDLVDLGRPWWRRD
jgi:osmotically inducible lipoprotein OsmB